MSWPQHLENARMYLHNGTKQREYFKDPEAAAKSIRNAITELEMVEAEWIREYTAETYRAWDTVGGGC